MDLRCGGRCRLCAQQQLPFTCHQWWPTTTTHTLSAAFHPARPPPTHSSSASRRGCQASGARAISRHPPAAAAAATHTPPPQMLLRIRLARFGQKNLPFYKLVVAPQRAPRDGKHLEVLGWYNPHPAADGNKHIGLKFDRVKHWLGLGAQPSQRATFLLAKAGLLPPPPLPPRFPKRPPAANAASK